MSIVVDKTLDVGEGNGRKFIKRKKLRTVRIEILIVSLREAGNQVYME